MGKVAAIGCAVLLVLGIIVGVAVGGQYNRLVQLDESVNGAWAQVENTYQRRADLIPNLVETVRGAAEFERGTFEAVAEARAKVGQINFEGVPDAAELARFQEVQGELSSAIARLLVAVERYPELRATQAFRDLQSQLEGTENRIAVERGRFNETAQTYNAARRRFPTVLIAGMLGFEQRPYFESTDGADTPPQVDFGNG